MIWEGEIHDHAFLLTKETDSLGQMHTT